MLARSVARYAGITYRQLDHWTREQYLRCPPTGSGTSRDYPAREARVAWWLARLSEAGLQHPVAAPIARRLAARGTPESGLVPLGNGLRLSVLGVAPPDRRRV